jgi:hypothetical protein
MPRRVAPEIDDKKRSGPRAALGNEKDCGSLSWFCEGPGAEGVA